MPDIDVGRQLTDIELAKLQKRIRKVYKQAEKELQKTIDDYFADFAQRDAKMLEKVSQGKITEEYYKQWRLNQIGRGRRYEALRDKCAERITRANEVAAEYINKAVPSVYALNRNYISYILEDTGAGIDFTIWNESAVRRLIVDKPNLMPYYPPERAVNRGIDLAYGQKQITATVTSGILQGKSVYKIAADLKARIQGMDDASAIRAARTAVTGAENGGRADQIHEAKDMGIKVWKRWVAIHDSHTRDSHRNLDGVEVEENEEFPNGLMYPGDPSGAPAEVYNCRCSLRAVQPETRPSKSGNTVESYKRWLAGKEETGRIQE